MNRLPPVYPVAIAVAFVLAVYSGGAYPASDLTRPLLIAVVVVAVIQILATVLLRDRDRGALVGAVVITALPTQPYLFVALLGLLAFLTIPGRLAHARGRLARPAPWASATRLLNLIAMVALVISVGQLAIDGRLTPASGIAEPIGPADPAAPDIYVILLDGHPRSDTLASEFGYDEEPFLAAMEGEGFEVARASRSNYDMTELTFSSMFQMQQLRDIPGFAEAASGQTDPRQDALFLSNVMAHARGFDELHMHGYQVVRIPSEFASDAPPADRSLDNAQLGNFEIDVLTETRLRTLAPDQMRRFAADQHRDHILASFDGLAGLAREQAAHPRFVFAHIISPHAPPVLGHDGVQPDGWPCFPATCSFWVTGEPSGHDAEVTMMREEVGAVDALTLETVRSIIANNARPAVVVVMSDHGGRNDITDRNEMLRSFFIAHTPDHPGLLPNDMTPVNLLPRLLNAYVGANLPMAPEDSHWADLDAISSRGIIDLVPTDPEDPPD